MPRARSQQVSLSDTPFYHCISRCVRRAFLCGEDVVTGKSFEHRRGWIEARLLYLSQIFSIDICAYAVMSNHLHIVLHVDEKQAKNWSTHEVLRRWHSLHKGTLFTQQFARGEASILACMAYVDLNPIRAGIATTPEKSEFTSIKKRVGAAKEGIQPKTLYPFVGN